MSRASQTGNLRAHRDQIADIVGELKRATSVLFVTGAGISAESGLPTYRGVGGLYERDVTDEGIPIEVALSGEMLRENPALCWKYIYQIEEACRGAERNEAHRAIAGFERQISRSWVLTQNVDGFHGDAGSKNLIEIHGNVRKLRCTVCSYRTEVTDYQHLTIPPVCPVCGNLIRPEVVLFGESLPPDAVETMQRELRTGFDIVFSIGTSSMFPYISQPVLAAIRQGVPTVEINPGETDLSSMVSHRLKLGAGEALAAIEKAMGRRWW
ncbi:MAG: NAD-dependent deacylase [Myxococcota bacterium]